METKCASDLVNSTRITEAETTPISHSVALESTRILVENDDEDYKNPIIEKINEIIPNLSTINIENSRDVVIGSVTQYHGPVVIYQNIIGNDHQNPSFKNVLQNANEDDNKSEELISTEKATFPEIISRRKNIKCLITSILTLLILIPLLMVPLLILIPHHPSEEMKSTSRSNNRKKDNSTVFYSRADWGGAPPVLYTAAPLIHPTKFITISHTGTQFCADFESCSSILLRIQFRHATVLGGEPDIGYNFLIGGDGGIYEGRGWNVASIFKENAIGIALIGNFVKDKITPRMASALRELLLLGVEEKKLRPDFKVDYDDQMYGVDNFGQIAYKIVPKFKHFWMA